jgi:hypothetical protein
MALSYLLLLALAAQAGASPPKPVERENWLIPGDVPIDVVRAHKGGVVGYELQVTEVGEPSACTITLSSGLPSLDKAACSALLERASFQPARDDQGRPIASVYRSKATFEPPVVDAKAREGPSLSITRITLNPDGSLVECGQEGDQPEPMSIKDCEQVLQSPKGAFFKEMAGSHKVFRIATAWTPPMYRARPALKSWGERLAYRIDEEIMNTEKLKFSCVTSKSDGRADLLGEGCVDQEKASPADIRRRHPGIVIRNEVAIFGVRR